MAAVLRIPEKTATEVFLTYKLTKSDAKLEAGAELVLEVCLTHKHMCFFFDNLLSFRLLVRKLMLLTPLSNSLYPSLIRLLCSVLKRLNKLWYVFSSSFITITYI